MNGCIGWLVGWMVGWLRTEFFWVTAQRVVVRKARRAQLAATSGTKLPLLAV